MQFGTGSQGEGNVFIGKSGAQAAGFISENFAEARFAERDALLLPGFPGKTELLRLSEL